MIVFPFAQLRRAGFALVIGLAGSGAIAQTPPPDLAACAAERVKTTVLPMAELVAAEAACSRVLAGSAADADRQKAFLFRGLMRFLQAVQKGLDRPARKDGSPAPYSPPTLDAVRPALRDIEGALALDGPLKADALALRVTINQTIGRPAEARADLEQATREPGSPTPFVQRALEHERAGNVEAALADLGRALAIDPKAPTALSARGDLFRRLGHLTRARDDLAGAAAAGPPYRRLALTRKSEVELRAGDLQAAHDDLVAAARERGDLSGAAEATARAQLLVRAGDLALDKLKQPAAAEAHYKDAQKLAPREWGAALGLGRVEEARGRREAAAALYRRILDATRATPRLFERLEAAARLRQLRAPPTRGAGGFRSALEIGVTAGKGSADGLRRVAFVIGQSDYADLAALPNARRDAAVMANALAEMGFDAVELGENLKVADLKAAVATVAARAADADVVLLFYAGHGIETGGVNYLIPVDATLDGDADLQRDALGLADLVAAAGKARRGALVIIDACRDDPFVEARAAALTRTTAQSGDFPLPERLHGGLATGPAPAEGTVVFHSTQPGAAALDGAGLDSPFVRGFLETLSAPGQSFDAVVRQTTARVSERTGGQQIPAAYGTAPATALLPPAAR